ncbi:hypothetical protein HAV15_005170 [Penicillium sp. str. |nr:hypothetical protein HAV15_005170 [Penicillium sp. str. \
MALSQRVDHKPSTKSESSRCSKLTLSITIINSNTLDHTVNFKLILYHIHPNNNNINNHNLSLNLRNNLGNQRLNRFLRRPIKNNQNRHSSPSLSSRPSSNPSATILPLPPTTPRTGTQCVTTTLRYSNRSSKRGINARANDITEILNPRTKTFHLHPSNVLSGDFYALAHPSDPGYQHLTLDGKSGSNA